nr:MAG TPA: hypothetical protein [Caudoviricetes sp.]
MTRTKNEIEYDDRSQQGRFCYTRVQSIALDLITNFTKTAVFCEVRRKSEPNLIIIPPLLERYFYI